MSATWAVVDPERPVTLGVPLPTYSVVILDPDEPTALHAGQLGEIGIAGIGLARGYVNRDDLTARAFIPDFVGIANNPRRRIYRTGDLGRINENGEVEYHGRIDTQVKVRGYRVELTEIESLILQVPEVAQAVVDTYEPAPGLVELVAYYSLRQDSASLDPALVYEHLRERLPVYMVPAYFEKLAVIPMLPSDKADRKNLPPPSTRLLGTPDTCTAPSTRTEEVLADALAAVLGIERVSADSHFFDDLGANSLLMAHFCARVRREGSLSVAMRDVYQQPTIQRLARALEAPGLADPDLPVGSHHALTQPVAHASTRQYIICGAAQLLLFLGATYVAAVLVHAAFAWVSAGTTWLDYWRRSATVSAATFGLLTVTPVVAKWVLVGRWHPQEIPVWSWAYLRFWVVKTLIRSSPLRAFVGSPLYSLYLRALGAKIGKDVVVLSATMPVCTDLLTIGDGSVIRKDASLACYRAHAGVIQTGPVTLGKDVLVCEATVLDIHTSMGDGSQLGHSSSLYSGQAVPQAQRWHGSPARQTDVNYRRLESGRCGMFRKFGYSALQLATALLMTGPLLLGLAVAVPTAYGDSAHLAITSWVFYRDLLVGSLAVFSATVLVALGAVGTLPRLLNLAFRTDRVYPLYGFHYVLHRVIAGMTNSRLFMEMFGDSSYIVLYLRWLGYDLGRVEQTGSNFGVAVKHESPFLSVVGTGTMVSDGLSFISADYSSTSFQLSRTLVGANNFLGNNIAYPSGGRTGDNCLLATKVMVPLDGPVREGVGLLGSPPFEIPRSVMRDCTFDDIRSPDQLRPRLAAKNRHNAVTIGAFVLARWGLVFVLLLLASIGAAGYQSFGALGLSSVFVLMTVVTVGYMVLVERAALSFRALQPVFCSIYDRPFWRHERYWKLSDTRHLDVFNGTPFKNVIWRLLGVRIGRRVFDDGCAIPEKSLVRIGDDCTLNALSTIQCHSMEDGSFKLQGISIGSGCTLGVNAFVHYGVTMGQGAVLEADSFLMKGEEIDPQSRWGGNPARELRTAPIGPLVGAAAAPVAGNALPPPASASVAPNAAGVPPSASSREARAASTPVALAKARDVLDDLRATQWPRLSRSSGVTLSMFSLAACRGRESELARFLGDEEREEASSLSSPVRRSTFVVSRALVRLLLSEERRADVAPGAWRFDRTAAGKLTVLGPEGAGMDVSISHSDSALAVAVSSTYEVGVDIEQVSLRRADPVVWPALSPAEGARLAATPEAERVAQFLQVWTLKEAYVKCAGDGSAVDFQRLETCLDPLHVAVAEEHQGGRHKYWFHQEKWTGAPDHHWISVVARTKGCEVLDLPRQGTLPRNDPAPNSPCIKPIERTST